MPKPKPRNTKPNEEEKFARLVLALVKVLDTWYSLRNVQKQLRRQIGVFKKLKKIRHFPDAPLRHLLATLTEKNTTLVDQISQIRGDLDKTCRILKPVIQHWEVN